MMPGPSPLAGSFQGMVSGGLSNCYSGGRVVWSQGARTSAGHGVPVPGMVSQCRAWCASAGHGEHAFTPQGGVCAPTRGYVLTGPGRGAGPQS